MTYYNGNQGFEERFEYHGSTAVERVRRLGGRVEHNWFYFNSVEEAADYFYDHCACAEAA